MFRVVSCLTTQHDWRLVLLAGAVCFLTSVAAINLFHRALATTDRARLMWLITTGAATGYGIWATHFIAMLAYAPGLPIGFDLLLTLASLVAATAITGAGFALAATSSEPWAAPAGGAIVGLGVAVMHYTGMSALDLPGRIVWSSSLVLASVALGVFLAVFSVRLAVLSRGLQATLVSALFLTLAIVSHHFTAMGAAEVVPDFTVEITPLSLSPHALAVAIASAAVAVLGISLVAALDANSRQQLREKSDAALAEQMERLETALANMSQGLCMFDRDQRVVVANSRYAEMYGLSLDQVKPGTTLKEILEARIARGTYRNAELPDVRAGASANNFHQDVKEILHLADGRFISVLRKPTPNGGIVSSHEDITERQGLHAQIEQQHAQLKAHEQELHTRNVQLDAALNNISQGLSMFDGSQRLVVCNEQYMRMYGFKPEQVGPGTTLQDIVEHRIAQGIYTGGDPEAYLRERLAPMTGPSDTLHELSDGRVVAMSRRPCREGAGLPPMRTSPSDGAPRLASPIWPITTC